MENMRTILPFPQSLPKDVPKMPVPQSPQQAAPSHECSSALNDVQTPATSDSSKCTILQGSEKENIQPASEESRCENATDCGNGDTATDSNEDIKV
jgi:hypothetical protein